MINYIDGDLIKLAKQGKFDVIVHGCNCFSTMKSGIAPQMAEAFGCDEFKKERLTYVEYDDMDNMYEVKTDNKGDINKLGTIDWELQYLWFDHPMAKDGLGVPMNSRSVGQPNTKPLVVVNAYTQYKYGRNHADGDKSPVDYAAIEMCMKKMNYRFKGKHIGLPKIGAGLAGGDWNRIEHIINTELKDCQITIVNYKPE